MGASTICRRGRTEDLSNMQFADGIAITARSVEFNVTGMGHEFWISYEDELIVGIAVLGHVSSVEMKIIYLQVGDSYRRRGVGSSLLQAIIQDNPGCDFTVVPFHGTEGFYGKLQFEQSGNLEMKFRASTRTE